VTVGRVVAAPTIERGVEVCLRYYLGPWLGEVLVQNGHARDDLADPQDLARVSEFTAPTQGQVTLVVVATPGTTGDAQRDADGYTLTWDVRAAVIADLGDRLESREAAQLYAAAAGTALTVQGVAAVEPDGRTWTRDAYGDLEVLEGSSVRLMGESYREIRGMPGVIAGEARVTVTVEDARPAEVLTPIEPQEPGTSGPRPEPVPVDPAPVNPSITLTRDPVED
jgi:hypothetical protein